jgi:8-oxo-dGTP pyrophosphatase MutT (NUDIX family)
MLRRCKGRGGFWQGVSGAPLADESDLAAAVREVREETGFDVASTIFPLGVTYTYALDPARATRWEQLYGPLVHRVQVVAFGAAIPDADPTLDPSEHDAFAWHAYEDAAALLDWPVETDALDGRLEALRALSARLPE